MAYLSRVWLLFTVLIKINSTVYTVDVLNPRPFLCYAVFSLSSHILYLSKHTPAHCQGPLLVTKNKSPPSPIAICITGILVSCWGSSSTSGGLLVYVREWTASMSARTGLSPPLFHFVYYFLLYPYSSSVAFVACSVLVRECLCVCECVHWHPMHLIPTSKRNAPLWVPTSLSLSLHIPLYFLIPYYHPLLRFWITVSSHRSLRAFPSSPPNFNLVPPSQDAPLSAVYIISHFMLPSLSFSAL